MQQIEQAEIDRRALGEFESGDLDGLAALCHSFRRDRIHQKMPRAVEQHGQRSEALFHGVLGDLRPDRRRAVVEPERVVDGRGEVESLPDHRDDLAIARIPRAGDGVSLDHGQCPGIRRCAACKRDEQHT